MNDSANRHPPHSRSLLGRVGRWGVSFVPDGWELIPDFGIHKLESGQQVANIHLSEDILPAGKALEPYLIAQKVLFGRAFADPKIAGPSEISFPGADEAGLLFLKHRQLKQTPAIIQSQEYVRFERWIGIVTFTATAERFSSFKSAYQSFAAGLNMIGNSV